MVNNAPATIKSYTSITDSNGSLGSNGSDDLTDSSHHKDKTFEIGTIFSTISKMIQHHHNYHHVLDNASTSTSTQKQYLQHTSIDDGTATNDDVNENRIPEYNMLAWTTGLLLGGTVLGLAFPKNPHLPSPTWQILSNVIGFTYFLAWSLSFYPQIFLNRQRKTTRGLSVDFCVLNVLGYICYTVYTTNFYWNESVIDAYKDKNSGGSSMVGDDTGENNSNEKGQITVQGNDVAFAIHALVMASFTLGQVGVYDSFKARPPSRRVYLFLFATGAFCTLYLLSTRILQGQINVLGFLYVLGTIKIIITIAKYIPQALLNRSRRSTVGWNVYNVILDLTGGVLSLLQLVGDCADMGDWTGITGNPAKISIALVTICFDLLFLVQHYIFYPPRCYTYFPTMEHSIAIESKDTNNKI